MAKRYNSATARHERDGKAIGLKPPDNAKLFLMNAAVVWAERISGATWRIYGPWNQPFDVDYQSFEEEFSDL